MGKNVTVGNSQIHGKRVISQVLTAFLFQSGGNHHSFTIKVLIYLPVYLLQAVVSADSRLHVINFDKRPNDTILGGGNFPR